MAGKVANLLGIATPAVLPTSAVGVASRGVPEAEELVAKLCVFAAAKLVTWQLDAQMQLPRLQQ